MKALNRLIFLRTIIFILLGFSLFTMWSFAPSSALAEAKVDFKVANYHPPAFVTQQDILDPWSKMVQERTGGKVKFTHYTGGSLVGARDIYSAAVKGLSDISHGYTGHTPGRFPLAEVVSLPFLGIKTALHGSRVVWALYEKFPEIQAEFDDVHCLWLVTHEPFVFHTKKPIRSVEDFKGMKIRVPGSYATYLKIIGATPVTMPGSEAYMALQKGIIEGNTGDWTQLHTYKQQEVTDYTTVVHFITGPFFVVMNKEKYESLSPEVRSIIDELSGKWGVEFAGKAWNMREKEYYDEAKGKPGRELIYFSEEETKKLKDRFADTYDEWVKAQEAKGLPGREIFEETIKLIAETPSD